MPRTKEVHNGMNIIDSRDVIERLKALESDRDTWMVDTDTVTGEDDSVWTAEDGTEFQDTWTEEEEAEYQALKALDTECKGYSADWHHGETLIRDSYFEDYARETAEDLGLLENCDQWPATCIDWEKAARELQQDYTSVDFDGTEYWIRS